DGVFVARLRRRGLDASASRDRRGGVPLGVLRTWPRQPRHPHPRWLHAFLVLTYRSPAPSDARLLYDASFGLLAMSAAPTVVALGAYSALVFRTRELPRAT